GERQILIVSDLGLTSVEPATGKVLWKAGTAMPGAPRAVLPVVVGPNRLLAASLEGTGVVLLEVGRKGGAWEVETRWESTALHPEFSDLVAHRGCSYGFDGAFFACVELEDGERCWKKGRYGRGQVILLANQSLLLVGSEKGEVVLLSANQE